MIDDLAGSGADVQAVCSNTVSWRNPQGGNMVAMAGITFIYAAAAIVGLQDAVVGHSITLIWAPSGIALAALLLLGARMAPAVALGAFLANAWTGVPLAVAAGITVGNTCEAVLGFWLLTRLTDFHRMLDRRRDVLAMIALTAVASTMASAAIGVFTLTAGGLMPLQGWAGAWVKWWLGDMMGVLVVAPAVLVWLGPKPLPVSSARGLEAMLLAATLVAASWLLFGGPEIAGRGYYPAALIVFPFVIWGALRFGQHGATLVTLAVSGLAVWGTMHGTGPFVVEGAVDSLVRWCTFAIIGAVTGLLLAALVAEQRRSQAELLRSYAELGRQVSERTRALQETNARLLREMSERRELENELIGVSEAQQRAIGRELHDGLGQHLTSLALLGAALHQRLDAHGGPELEAVTRIVALANQANTMTQTLARGLFPVAYEYGAFPASRDKLA
jgi:integral membrane sensor domain MASE1